MLLEMVWLARCCELRKLPWSTTEHHIAGMQKRVGSQT
ncbi:MAG: hypothetical protein ACI8W3_003200, partial [Myxococcota bacterium]